MLPQRHIYKAGSSQPVVFQETARPPGGPLQTARRRRNTMNNQALNLDEAMQLVSEAFLPCGCVTSANPDDDSFGFTVMSASGTELLRVPGVSHDEYSNPQHLGTVIEQARLDVEEKDQRLEPWTMPSITDGTGIPETPPNY